MLLCSEKIRGEATNKLGKGKKKKKKGGKVGRVHGDDPSCFRVDLGIQRAPYQKAWGTVCAFVCRVNCKWNPGGC